MFESIIHQQIKEKLFMSESIEPILKGSYIGNYKCHLNCLSYARKHKKLLI